MRVARGKGAGGACRYLWDFFGVFGPGGSMRSDGVFWEFGFWVLIWIWIWVGRIGLYWVGSGWPAIYPPFFLGWCFVLYFVTNDGLGGWFTD